MRRSRTGRSGSLIGSFNQGSSGDASSRADFEFSLAFFKEYRDLALGSSQLTLKLNDLRTVLDQALHNAADGEESQPYITPHNPNQPENSCTKEVGDPLALEDPHLGVDGMLSSCYHWREALEYVRVNTCEKFCSIPQPITACRSIDWSRLQIVPPCVL